MFLYLTKERFLEDEKSRKEVENRQVLCFCLRLLSQKYGLQSFDPKYLRNCYKPC